MSVRSVRNHESSDTISSALPRQFSPRSPPPNAPALRPPRDPSSPSCLQSSVAVWPSPRLARPARPVGPRLNRPLPSCEITAPGQHARGLAATNAPDGAQHLGRCSNCSWQGGRQPQGRRRHQHARLPFEVEQDLPPKPPAGNQSRLK